MYINDLSGKNTISTPTHTPEGMQHENEINLEGKTDIEQSSRRTSCRSAKRTGMLGRDMDTGAGKCLERGGRLFIIFIMRYRCRWK